MRTRDVALAGILDSLVPSFNCELHPALVSVAQHEFLAYVQRVRGVGDPLLLLQLMTLGSSSDDVSTGEVY